MKVIVAGTRNYIPYQTVAAAIRRSGLEVTVILSGNCSGVDLEGERYGGLNGIPVLKFPADWDKHGRAAGPIRNKQMAVKADALILIWDGKSRGSASMKKEATRCGLPIYEHIIN